MSAQRQHPFDDNSNNDSSSSSSSGSSSSHRNIYSKRAGQRQHPAAPSAEGGRGHDRGHYTVLYHDKP